MENTPRPTPRQPRPYGVRRYLLGILIGLLCAAACVVASFIALTGSHYDGLLVIMIGLYICAPLLVLLFIAWLIYFLRDRSDMPGRAHGWLWLPTLSAALILPVAGAVDDWRKARRESAFPPVSELHVNLTGQNLWIPTYGTSTSSGTSPGMPMRADQPGDFVELTRWSGTVDPLPGPLFPYAEGRLLPEFDRLPRQLETPPNSTVVWPKEARAYAPWTLSNPIPPIDALRPHVDHFNAGNLVQYIYYHYPDHIEIAPVLRNTFDLHTLAADALPVPLVAFHGVNMTSEAIVRLEVNGQAVRVGYWRKALAPMKDCRRGPAGLGVAQVSLDAPLHIRWQTSRAPHAWRQAQVSVPRLEDTLPPGTQPLVHRIMLYFDENDQVLAEHYQEVRLDGPAFEGRLGLRLTGVPQGLSRTPPCQSALSSYDPGRVLVLPTQPGAPDGAAPKAVPE